MDWEKVIAHLEENKELSYDTNFFNKDEDDYVECLVTQQIPLTAQILIDALKAGLNSSTKQQ